MAVLGRVGGGAGELVLLLPLGVWGRGGAGELLLFLPLAVAGWLNSRPHKSIPLKTHTGVTQLMSCGVS